MADRVGQQLGNYHLIQLLGQGGFAEVYLGEHRYLKSHAALKVLHTAIEDKRAEQFLSEAQTLVRLVHPNIVRVLDFTIEQGTPVLVMDYAPQGTLRDQHPADTSLPLATVVSYVTQIATALQYAHNHNLIHRDVKPENMLLGPEQQVLLSDFGLALFSPASDLLSTQKMSGTIPYIAPEQLQGHPCFASDQYALGIVAYEWLCGRRPFVGSSWHLIHQHVYAAPPPLRESNPSVPASVEAVVLRALAKDPRQRFVSVQAFALALERTQRETVPGDEEDAQITASLKALPRSSFALSPRHAPTDTDSPQRIFLAATPADETVAAHLKDDVEAQAFAESGNDTHPLHPPPPPSIVRPPPPTTTPHHTTPAPTALPPQRMETQTEQTVSSTKDVNRKRLLAKVRAFWITGVLEHSLHGAALIALGLHEQPGAVTNPWHLVLKSPDEPDHGLPPGTPIAQVYDDAVGELLILGQPGSGKTTLLLELARTLLDRASQDDSHPMPVVFNLSSWATERQPLTEWLVAELNSKYQVPRKLAQSWVDADQILPLLDGLDEVAPLYRAACMEAINIYRLSHGLVPTIVCSRSAEYLAQTVHVLLRNAVVVQPLTTQQIDAYLSSAGGQLESLRAALRADAALQELATTPLVLSVLTLAYHGKPVAELLAAHSPETQRRQVFEAYVTRVLEHRGTDTRYTPQQTLHWLSSLARQMARQSQTVFYIEHMQPDWLPQGRVRWVYEGLAVQLPGILIGVLVSLIVSISFSGSLITRSFIIFGLIGGLIGGLFSGSNIARQSPEIAARTGKPGGRRLINARHLKNGVLVGLLFGLSSELIFGSSFGLIFGLSVGLSSVLLSVILERGNRARPGTRMMSPSRRSIWHNLINAGHVRNGVLIGLLFGLSFGLADGLSFGLLIFGLSKGLSVGLIFGLVGFLLSVLLRKEQTSIQPAEMIVWSWRSIWHSVIKVEHLRNGLIVGLVVGLIFGLADGLLEGPSTGLSTGLSSGLIAGLIYWLLIGLFGGLSSDTLSEHQRLKPNQGIECSARNAVLIGLISGFISWLSFGLIAGLIGWLSFGPSFGLIFGLTFGPIFGLAAGLLAGLLSGGRAYIQHIVLRLFLWRAGYAPLNYPRFLDYAAERILLRKAGGGYIFVHRLLLDYFATLDTAPAPNEAAIHEQEASPMV